MLSGPNRFSYCLTGPKVGLTLVYPVAQFEAKQTDFTPEGDLSVLILKKPPPPGR